MDKHFELIAKSDFSITQKKDGATEFRLSTIKNGRRYIHTYIIDRLYAGNSMVMELALSYFLDKSAEELDNV